MLDFGFSEILLTSAIALVVLGPERLPKVARQVGNWMGRARAMARQLSDQLEREVNAEELLKQHGKTLMTNRIGQPAVAPPQYVSVDPHTPLPDPRKEPYDSARAIDPAGGAGAGAGAVGGAGSAGGANAVAGVESVRSLADRAESVGGASSAGGGSLADRAGSVGGLGSAAPVGGASFAGGAGGASPVSGADTVDGAPSPWMDLYAAQAAVPAIPSHAALPPRGDSPPVPGPDASKPPNE